MTERLQKKVDRAIKLIRSAVGDDVAEFVQERGIKCHPLYYDWGNFTPKGD